MFGGRGGETNGAGLLQSAGIVALKLLGFVAFMLIVARRILPALLHWTAHTGSRELFRLAVLAIALGVAFGAAVVFDVSFALGAFFAGMILGETQLSRRAAEETLRSEEHTSELQSLMRSSYAVFCLKKQKKQE